MEEEEMMTDFFNGLPRAEKGKVMQLYFESFEEFNSAHMMMRFYLLMTLSLKEIEPILDGIEIMVVRYR